MEPILSSENQTLLRAFMGRSTLLVFDYDGTLAPIVAEPAQAQLRSATRELLRQLSRHYPIAIITGRARLDVLRFLDGIPVLEVIGSHGFETYGATPHQALRRVGQWHQQLMHELLELPCARIENKRFSLAVHYRSCGDPAAASATIRAAAGQLAQARLIGGKRVLNIVPQEAPDKGVALIRLCERLGYARAIYVGDDDTDEDVFALDPGQGILSIRVGVNEDSSARYYLDSQQDMDEFLDVLGRCRSG